MQQVQQEAAIANARALVTVTHPLSLPNASVPRLDRTKLRYPSFLEHQPKLLREVRAETRNLNVKGRGSMFHDVHGEIHGGLEYG